MMIRQGVRWPVLLVAASIGLINALVLKGFEFIAIEGTVWWWNDLWHADEYWWGAIVLAIGGGLIFGLLIHLTRQRRVPVPQPDPMAEHGPPGPVTLGNVGLILLTGAASLTLAGASLGPEAPLMAFATVLGLWMATKAGVEKQATQLLALASVGALLVAFLGSLVPMLLPVLVSARQAKLPWKQPRILLGLARKRWRSLLAVLSPVVLASVASFVTLWFMDPSVEGYGSIPVGLHFGWQDFVLAPLVGILAVLVGWMLKKSIVTFGSWALSWEKKMHWAVFATIGAVVVGILYVIGGPSVRFSGSVGTNLLIHNAPELGLAALIVLLIVKLLVTSWSMAIGYRGGLVFPSIYMGVAIALIVEAVFGLSGPGIILGAIAGVFGSMTGPAVALIFITSVIPPAAGMWVLALLAIIGAAIGNKVLKRAMATKKS